MIRLPKSLKLGAHTVKVKRVGAEVLQQLCGKPAWGAFDPAKMIIYVSDIADDAMALVTYYHELLHAINCVLGIEDESKAAHRNVDLMGQLLAQATTSSKF